MSSTSSFNIIKLILFIIFINQMVTQTSSQNATSRYELTENETIDLMTIKYLTFYRDLYTRGTKKQLQMQCVSFNDECDFGPGQIVCQNNDYKNYSKLNSTSLSWSCTPDQLMNAYFIEQKSVDVQCEESFKTEMARYIVSGSCWVSFILYRTPIYKTYLFIFIVTLVIALSIGLFFYFRNLRKRGYTQV